MDRHTDFAARFDGLIFDCDGTIADTMGAHYAAWRVVMREAGLPFPIERFWALAGVPTVNIVMQIAREQGLVVDAPAICARRDALFETRLSTIGPVESVVAIARAATGRRPMAVASGSTRAAVWGILAHLGLDDGLFSVVLGAEDTARPKPAPDVFLLAASRMGVDAARCCVFEDSDLGLEAARSAGMVGVDVRPWYEPDWPS